MVTKKQLEQRINAGRRLAEKYGDEYMQGLAKKGGRALHDRYRMVPCGTNNFAYVDRETLKIKAYQYRPRSREEQENMANQVFAYLMREGSW